MPGKGRDCAGCGQRLDEEYRFCPICGTARPSRSVKASPAPVFTPEEILATEPPPASPEAPPTKAKDEEQVAEALQGRSAGPVPETTHIAAPQADAPTPQDAAEPTGGNKLRKFVGNAVAFLVVSGVIFAVLSFFGVPLMLSALVGAFVTLIIILRGPPAELKNRSARTAPARSRSIPQWVKIAVATRDGGTCRRCGSSYELQYDHIVPYSLGGSSTDVNNIQLLCGRCNRRKSNRYVG